LDKLNPFNSNKGDIRQHKRKKCRLTEVKRHFFISVLSKGIFNHAVCHFIRFVFAGNLNPESLPIQGRPICIGDIVKAKRNQFTFGGNNMNTAIHNSS